MTAPAAHPPAHPASAARPGPNPATWPGHPILGALPDLRRDELGTFERMARGARSTRFRVLMQRFHLLTGPEQVQHVLVDNVRNYGKQTFGYERLRTVVGNGLLTSEGKFWRRQRRIAQPAFHRRRIEAFAALMTDAATETAERWRDGAVVDISREMMRLTLRVVGLTLLSRDVAGEAQEIGDALTTGLEHLMHRMQTPWSPPEWVPTRRNRRFRAALATIDRVVAEIIAERRRRGPGAGDFLDMLMSAGDGGDKMSDAQLRDEVMTIFLAGHETTAMALTWSLYLLAQNPAVERRLRRELDDALGGRIPGVADLDKLPYTERVVLEAMRLYPPVWVIARSATADDDVCGHPVRAGDWVMISPWVTQRRPDLWPKPEVFDPDRFAPEQAQARHRYAYFPFAGGQRKCIGDRFALMEARLVLATLLSRVRLTLLPGHRVEPEPLVTLRPRGGLPMRVERLAAPPAVERPPGPDAGAAASR